MFRKQSWLAGLFLLTCVTSARAEPPAPTRPNILVLLTDDQRWDAMGCAGNKLIHTPNMDALARDGVRFRNMFVTTPICAASRACLLTGLYERTHRHTFDTKPISSGHIDITFPVLLKKAGYRTGHVGKLGVGIPMADIGRVYDSFALLKRTPYWKKQPGAKDKHLTIMEGEKAIEFLAAAWPAEPFCLYVCFNAPHAEDNDPKQYYWPTEVDALYRNTQFPVPKTMTDDFFNAQPAFLKNSDSRVRFKWRFDEPKKYQEMVRGYYRMISGVDVVIGRIREALKKHKLDDNTVIIFTSDNGYFLGERGFADKWYLYEPSLRVPLIIFDPRAKPALRGRVVDEQALNIDLCPTVLELAGVQVPKLTQGRSLVPILQGKTPADWRTDFFCEHLFDNKMVPKSEGVRNQRFTYLRWFEQKPVVEELYDHVADFDETHNLVKDARYADVLDKLRKRTTELRDKYGGPFRPNPPDKPKK